MCGMRSGTGFGTAQDCPGRSALMASPDGLGWPEEFASFSLGAARDESRFMTVGLGWPSHRPVTGRPVPSARPVAAGAGHDAARPARNVGSAGEDGQGQVFREGEPVGPPVRVKQALSAAVSRETDARNVSTRDEAQGSGTVRTRGKPAGGAGALLEQEAPGKQGSDPAGSRPTVPAPGKPDKASARPGAGDRKSTRLNSSHLVISYAVFCLKKKTN